MAQPIPDGNSVILHASDDLMTRAQNIVHILGYRGAVGNFVVDVYRVLQRYEALDRETVKTKNES